MLVMKAGAPPGAPQLAIRDKTSDFSGLSIVDTRVMGNAEAATLYGPEFGVALGPWFMVGEYSTAKIDNYLMPSVKFDAWHLYTTWMLSGESYATRYRISDGEFKNVRPSRDFDPRGGGFGAWELGLRYAAIDLNDADFIGGEEDAASLALNWYLNRHLRLMFDWTRVLDTDGSSDVRLYAPDMNIFTLRSQLNF
jgi:phosphate-selective porin OprO/OprP